MASQRIVAVLTCDFVHIIEGNQDAAEELESCIKDEPEYLEHVTQRLRDDRDSAVALAQLKATLEAQGKTIVEDAGHIWSVWQ